MTRKVKQPAPRLTSLQRLVIAITAIVLSLLLLQLVLTRPFWKTISPDAAPREVLMVPFDKLEPTYSAQTYSGKVGLIISGTGQAGGTDYSDAFYLYETGEGASYLPPLTHQFDLEIDGDRAINTLGLSENPPSYSSDHVYQVTYDVGPEPRQIAFRISDSVVNDNTGQFEIKIFINS